MADDPTSGIQASDQMQQAMQGMTAYAPPPPPPQPAPPAPAPAAPAPAQSQQQEPQHPGIAGVLQGVLNMLTGRRAPSQVAFDPNTGQRIDVPGASLTRGQQFAKLGLAALQGAATAAAAPPGPGHTAAGVSAAVQQQANLQRQAKLDQEQQAEKDFTRQQQTQKFNIEHQLAQRQLAEFDLDAKRKQTVFDESQVEWADKERDKEVGLHSVLLGRIGSGGDFADLGNRDPNLIQDMHDNNLQRIPMYADGKVTGFEVWRRNPDVKNMPIAEGSELRRFHPPPFGQPVTAKNWVIEHPDPLKTSNGQLDAYQAAEDLKAANYQKELDAHNTAVSTQNYQAAEGVKARAEASKATQEAAKAKAEADLEAQMTAGGGKASQGPAAGLPAFGGFSATRLLNGIVSGQLDPDKVFGAGSRSGNNLMAMIRAQYKAAALAQDPTWTDYRYAQNKQVAEQYSSQKAGDPGSKITSYNTYMQHAAALKAAMQRVPASSVPYLNNKVNWLKTNFQQHPELTEVKTELEAVQHEYESMLRNSALTDTDIAQGKTLLNENMGIQNFMGAMNGMVHIALTRAGTLNQAYKTQLHRNVPNLFQPLTQQAIQGFGLSNEAERNAPGSMLSEEVQQQHAVARALGIPEGAQYHVDERGRIDKYLDPKTGKEVEVNE